MKTEILKESLRNKTCKFRLSGWKLLDELIIKFKYNVKHGVDIVVAIPKQNREFNFTYCGESCCGGWCSDYPNDESFISRRCKDGWVMDILYPHIISEIDNFELRLNLYKLRNKKWLIDWINSNIRKK